MEFGLSRITRLVREHNKVLPWKAFHIAGTNGKGSTSAFLSGFLHKAGVKVGRFNSPHLVDRHDCISINEQTISKSLFNEAELEVTRRDRDLGTKATPFELLTATAFEAFNRAGIDVGVIECGLGGKDDATNVLLPEEVLCSIITSIGFDHKEILGPTKLDIAAAKAGIIKSRVPVVFSENSYYPEIVQLFKQQARRQNAAYRQVNCYTPTNKYNVLKGDVAQILDLPNRMVDNVMLAWTAYGMASKNRPSLLPSLLEEDAMEVAKSVRQSWQGRLQWISLENYFKRKNPILIDGAHNPQALGSLRRYLDYHIAANSGTVSTTEKEPEFCTIKHTNPTAVPITWVFASSVGKNHHECFRKFLNTRDKIILTQFPSDLLKRKAWSALQLVQRHTGDTSVPWIRTCPDPEDALRTAILNTPEESPIVITGSLYLVGEILRMLHKDRIAQIGSWIPLAKGPPLDRKREPKL
jgi:dihydrofolate synthase